MVWRMKFGGLWGEIEWSEKFGVGDLGFVGWGGGL